MVVHSCWGSVSVFFRSQIHPKIKGLTLSWNKTVCFNHVKNLSLHRMHERKGDGKRRAGKERGEKDLRRKDERREYGEDKHSVCLCEYVSQSLSHIRLYVTLWTIALQAPLSVEISCKNTGVGSQSILQEIFPTQGSNSGLLHCRQILYRLSHQGSQINILSLSYYMKLLWSEIFSSYPSPTKSKPGSSHCCFSSVDDHRHFSVFSDSIVTEIYPSPSCSTLKLFRTSHHLQLHLLLPYLLNETAPLHLKNFSLLRLSTSYALHCARTQRCWNLYHNIIIIDFLWVRMIP